MHCQWEVPHHFRALHKSFLCLGLSVPFMGGIYAKLKKSKCLIIFWSFGMNVFTICQCIGKLHISYDFCLNFVWYRSHHSFNGEKIMQIYRVQILRQCLHYFALWTGKHVPHTLTILIGYWKHCRPIRVGRTHKRCGTYLFTVQSSRIIATISALCTEVVSLISSHSRGYSWCIDVVIQKYIRKLILARILPWMYITYLDVSTCVKFLNGL